MKGARYLNYQENRSWWMGTY